MQEDLKDEDANFHAPTTGFQEGAAKTPENPGSLSIEAGKAKLNELLANPGSFESMQTITVQAESESSDNQDWNFPFLRLLESKLNNAKILDLFCGSNPFKYFLAENGIPGQAVGVDIVSPDADIQADVSKIPEILSPTGQFDFVTSFGSHPGFENFAADSQYLKDGGLYIFGASDESFEDVEAELNRFKNNPNSVQSQEAREVLKYFDPFVTVRLNGIPVKADADGDFPGFDGKVNKVYLICRKRGTSQQPN